MWMNYEGFLQEKYDVSKARQFNSEHTCSMQDRVLTKNQAIAEFASGLTSSKIGQP